MSDEPSSTLPPKGEAGTSKEQSSPSSQEGAGEKKKKGWFRRHAWDMGLLCFLLLGTAAAFIVRAALTKSNRDQLTAVLSVSGKEKAQYKLWEYGDTPAEEVIQGAKGELTLQMKHNAIRVKEAECPNQTCVHQGWVSQANHPIICAYNQVVISIVGGDDSVVVIG